MRLRDLYSFRVGDQKEVEEEIEEKVEKCLDKFIIQKINNRSEELEEILTDPSTKAIEVCVEDLGVRMYIDEENWRFGWSARANFWPECARKAVASNYRSVI